MYKWRATFKLLNVKLTNIGEWSGNGFKLKKHPSEDNAILGECTFETEDTKNVVEIAEAEIGKFLNMLILAFRDSAFSPVFKLVDFKIDLTNRKELYDRGVSVPADFEINVNMIPKLSDRLLDENLAYMKKLFGSGDAEFLYQVITYYRKGVNEDNPFDKFVWLWTALNSLYEKLAEKGDWGDIKCINYFSNNFLSGDGVEAIVSFGKRPAGDWIKTSMIFTLDLSMNNYSNIFDFFIKNQITNRDKTRNYSDELKEAINKGNNKKEMVCKAILCLYGMRNQIVHGAYYSNSGTDLSKINIASTFLGLIVFISINEYIRQKKIIE